MTRDDVMLPFATQNRVAYEVIGRFRPLTWLEPSEDVMRLPVEKMKAELANFNELIKGLSKVDIPGFSLRIMSGPALFPVGQEPEGQTAEEYHARSKSIRSLLDEAGISGSHEALGLPAGWLTVLEKAAEGFKYRLMLEEGASIKIQQIKEKFGSLRLYVHPTGSEQFCKDVQDIANWAEGQTEDRCCVTGKKGTMDNKGWVLCLSDEMKARRAEDPKTFGELVYPREPKPEDPTP